MKEETPLNLELHYKEAAEDSSEKLYVFLHGYSQDMTFLYNYFNKDCKKKNKHAIFIQAPFPLVGRFPLDTTPDKKKLFNGYAWYFYDAQSDEYIIPVTTPASWIKNFLHNKFPHKKDITLVGYSQGGYLSPFIAQEVEAVKHIIGINCSFRYDLLSTFSCPRVDQLQGVADVIVTPELAQQRYHDFQKKYSFSGSFQMVENETHKLTTSLKNIILEFL
tara:strand:- start:131259 stop:131915 length:657 start_codon:yes stop_codon:yes gene_type:complete